MDILAKTFNLFQVFHFLITVSESSDYCIKSEINFFRVFYLVNLFILLIVCFV